MLKTTAMLCRSSASPACTRAARLCSRRWYALVIRPMCHARDISEDTIEAIGLAKACLHQGAFTPAVAPLAGIATSGHKPSTRGGVSSMAHLSGIRSNWFSYIFKTPQKRWTGAPFGKAPEMLGIAICACRYFPTLD
ncbi:hypothetical protein [Bradyrhizobium sp. CCBAU 53380]|uniref:hypothetical protein n=1 Tax=Bradyrhizobium sp. CCBAU 53380 TaxID=1325117 RepID=UPI0023026CAA|nr:hypothetical protein [Bradyrhizobium sp. CCBAU 53380]